MSSEDNADSSQSPGGGARLPNDNPITTRSGRSINVDEDADNEPEHTSTPPPAPAPLPSTPVQQLIFNTEFDADMTGNMASEDQPSAGEPTVTRQKGPQYRLPPEFVPASASGGMNGGQAPGEIPPPQMFSKIRTACAEAVPICFTLQEELQREDGLREYSQMTYFSRARRVGDCLIDIRLTVDMLEQRVVRDIMGQANLMAAIAEQRDAAAAEVERLRRQLRQAQAELVAATAAAAAYQDGSGRGGPRAGGGSGVQPPSSYSQVIGDLRRRPDQHDVPPSYGMHRFSSTNSRNQSTRLGNASLRGSASRGGRGYYSGSRGGYVRFTDDHSGYRNSSSVPYRQNQAGGGTSFIPGVNSGSSISQHNNNNNGGVQLLTMQAHAATSATESGPESPARQRGRNIQAARRAAALDDLRSSAYGGNGSESSAHGQQQQQPQQQHRDAPAIGPTPRQLAQALERKQQARGGSTPGPDASTRATVQEQGPAGKLPGAISDGRSGYWEPEDGGSPIPLLKNNMDFPRSTSDLKKGDDNGGVGNIDKGDVSSPSGDSSLHPSSSASNIRPRDPTPFRGQITPRLPDEGGAGAAHPPPSGGNNNANSGGSGAFQMHGPSHNNNNNNANYSGPRDHGRDKENHGRQNTGYYSNNSNNRAGPSRPPNHGHHGQRNYHGPRGGGSGRNFGNNHTNNSNALVPHRGEDRDQDDNSAAAFTADDGLDLDKVGREWRRELEQVFTLFAGWVRKNCRVPNPAADSGIAASYPRLWAYMLSVAYPDGPERAASHVQFLLSDPEIRCYFICRLLLQYVVMDVFRTESWLGVNDRSTAELQIVLGTRDVLISKATSGMGASIINGRSSKDNNSNETATDGPPEMCLSRHNRQALQVARAECVARLLTGPDWPRFRQMRINACVNRFKDIVGPLMDDRVSRTAASHDLYSIAVNAIETSARVLSSSLSFSFGFSDTGARFARRNHHPINSSRDPRELHAMHWRIMCVVTPSVAVRDDSGDGPEHRIIAKAKVLVMA
ncbi:hypothetical protein GGTG_04494 [Gaeumannomyces tritici R3-111a-1]|uniref:Uncharacterized protein n=1 Tax=Gaeumannomyces tritici (strain R3-111a-1) TaxID=644352 RepID=J3NT95_GAET3|nr:hypothetical protein GGTG_04494 [Gaeumannomyces tritici R3-111a-1]EJT79410.1 hypothetical protein GGTG_04494 [Gaeumannomyces tritici R3-111a-1]